MSEKVNQVRQGDLLFTLTENFNPRMQGSRTELPIKDGRIILAEGEKTGHVHTIPEASVEALFGLLGDTVIVVTEDTEVTHDEHDPVPLTEGNWLMNRQQEYVPDKNPRPVID